MLMITGSLLLIVGNTLHQSEIIILSLRDPLNVGTISEYRLKIYIL